MSFILPEPKPAIEQNTLEFETIPLVKPTGFREYDARWLFGDEINLLGIQALGQGLGTLIREMGKDPRIVVGHDFRGACLIDREYPRKSCPTTMRGSLPISRISVPRPCPSAWMPKRLISSPNSHRASYSRKPVGFTRGMVSNSRVFCSIAGFGSGRMNDMDAQHLLLYAVLLYAL